jgi:hypothetical protein
LENGEYDLTDVIEFAVSGKQVVRNGEPMDLREISGQFDDMRHLFRLAELPPGRYFAPYNPPGEPQRSKWTPWPFKGPGGTWPEGTWRPWFGDCQLLEEEVTRERAFMGPVLLDCDYKAMGADREIALKALEDERSGYERVARPPDRPGQFRPHPTNPRLIEVWLMENVYPFTFIALGEQREQMTETRIVTPSNVVMLFASGGLSGRQGLTLREAVGVLRSQVEFKKEGVVYNVCNALLIDQGLDVFHFVDDEFKVPIEGPGPLPEEGKDTRGAIGRDRLRAIFLVAEEQKEQPCIEKEKGEELPEKDRPARKSKAKQKTETPG